MNSEERPEYGADHNIRGERGRVYRYLQNTPIEDFPKHAKMRGEIHQDWDRHRGYKFDALKGMLRSGVGKPWVKTHQKIVAYIKENYKSDIWKNLLSWVNNDVEVSPMYIGEGVYVQANGRPFRTFRGHQDYFVDPVTGNLTAAKKEWEDIRFPPAGSNRRYDVHKDKVVYFQNRCYRNIHGIWYEAILVNVPKSPDNQWPQNFYSQEKNWLYQQNIVDAVLKDRIGSWMMHDLAWVHGYRTYENELVSYAQYQKYIGDRNRESYYMDRTMPLIGERYVYAQSLRQISKSEIKQLGMDNPNLTLPNIVRK